MCVMHAVCQVLPPRLLLSPILQLKLSLSSAWGVLNCSEIDLSVPTRWRKWRRWWSRWRDVGAFRRSRALLYTGLALLTIVIILDSAMGFLTQRMAAGELAAFADNGCPTARLGVNGLRLTAANAACPSDRLS
jgi:hypothetical protein